MKKMITAILISLLLASATAADVSVRVIALFTNKALLEVNGEQKIVKKGETFQGVTLKSASGRGAEVVIDGKTMKLEVNQRIAGNFKKPDRNSLKIFPDSLGMFYTMGSINGVPTRFLVDTGATFVTMSGKKARALSIKFHEGLRSTAQTASTVVPVWQIKLDSVDVGGIQLRNVDATVIEGNQPFEVLLGNSFLQHTNIQQTGTALEIHKKY